MANGLRSVAFLNYRLGQMRATGATTALPEDDGAFAPEAYDARERLYNEAEPGLLNDQILVRGPRARDYSRLLSGLDRLAAACEPRGCALLVVVIPHFAQVNSDGLDRARAIGARFEDGGSILASPYPFLRGITERLAAHDGARVVDPLGRLRDAERAGHQVYFSNNGHLNRRGQQVVGALLVEALAAGE